MKADNSIEEVYSLKNRLAEETTVNHLEEVLSLACAMLCELCNEIEIDPMRLSEYREKRFKDE